MSGIRPLQFLVDDVRRAMAEGRPCTLLIGAGCSVTAGIPTAQGFVDLIKKDYRHRWELAPTKTYAECMAQLENGDRDRLIQRSIEGAKVNSEHLAMASLVKEGYVDRVLTTNFDPLVVQACALLNQFPAVYDCAASTAIDPRRISGQAVFHLHGQYRGPVLINTQTELRQNRSRVRRVVEDALSRERIIIIVGYSGANDPVFELLAKPKLFRTPVVWVSYRDEPPPGHVRQRLLREGKGAYRIDGFTADSFLVALAQGLDAFPPDLLRRPFCHVRDCLASVRTQCELRLPGQEEPVPYEFGLDARRWVELAMAVFEQGDAPVLDVAQLARDRRKADVEELLLAGRYAEVAAMHQAVDRETSLLLAGTFAVGYALWGSELTERATQQTHDQAVRGLKDACEKHAIAAELAPGSHEILCAWGKALALWAERSPDEQAECLFAQASEKYQGALKINADSAEVLNNLGNTLTSQAKRLEHAQALPLLRQAYAKYAEATRRDSSDHVALTNWANGLYQEALRTDPPDRDALLSDACSKCETALKIKPESYRALSVYGSCLAQQGRHAQESASDALFRKACCQYQKAIEINDNYVEGLANWARALSWWASREDGSDAERLYAEAFRKYEAAVKIRADSHEALNNWGCTLAEKALRTEGAQRDRLLVQACAKYGAALAAKADKNESLSNWACALIQRALLKTGVARRRLLVDAVAKFRDSVEIRPDAMAYCGWGFALYLLARTGGRSKAEALLRKSRRQYEAALAKEPDLADALNGLATTLLGLGGLKDGAEARELFAEAKDNALVAERIQAGVGGYNAACACARLGEEEECRSWLERCRDKGALPSREHISEDDDLASVRSKSWFKEILASASEQASRPVPQGRGQ